MSIQDAANVNITAATRGISRQGFGSLAIVAGKLGVTGITEAITDYSSLSEMVTAGFTTSNPIYRRALAALSAIKKNLPIRVIDTGDTSTAHTVDMTPTVLPPVGHETVLTFYVTGQAVQTVTLERTVGHTDLPTWLTALQASVTALSGITATEDGTTMTVATSGGDHLLIDSMDYQFGVPNFTIEDVTALDASLETAVTAINAGDSDWFGFVTPYMSKANINALASFAEGANKLFMAQTADSDVLTSATDDVASVQMNASRSKTIVAHHPNMSDAIGPGLMMRQLATTVGTTQWQFKQVPGSVSVPYSTTQTGFMDAKNVTYMIVARRVNASRGGLVAGGEWIDVIRLIEFLRSRIAEDVYSAQLNAEKIPYNTKGIESVRSTVQGRLDSKIGEGLSDDPNPPVVTVPALEDTTEGDRTSRVLNNVEFDARLEGAIILANINGTVTV